MKKILGIFPVLPQCDRLAGGLQKIADASEMLAVLNEKLAVQKVGQRFCSPIHNPNFITL